jgi:hypothetical protein
MISLKHHALSSKIAIGSQEWNILIAKVENSKRKSNRDLLCTQCWQVYTYEMSLKHKKEAPTHADFLLTTKHYSSDEKLLRVSQQCGKVSTVNGMVYLENPYKKVRKPGFIPKISSHGATLI